MKRLEETTLEMRRIRRGPFASDASYGMNGMFIIPCPTDAKLCLAVVCDDGQRTHWEHVSAQVVHRKRHRPVRIPTWDEMCYLKDIFWHPEETVLQFHPPHSQYVNMHPNVLHLWRHKFRSTELPPSILVGWNLNESLTK